MKEIDDQVLLIVKYVRELKQAEDVGDWDKVVSLSDAIQKADTILEKLQMKLMQLSRGGCILDKFSVTNLAVGTRGTAKEFLAAHTRDFLGQYGFKTQMFQDLMVFMSVKTKYGEMVVHKGDFLVYVGKGIWSLSKK